MAEKLSFTAYARHRGVTPATVTKAVASGRISTERDPRSGRRVIDPEVADREWEERTDRAKQEGSKAHQRQRRGDGPDAAHAINVDQPENPTTAPEALQPSTAPKAAPAPPSDQHAALTHAQAKARREFYNAELARLSFEQKYGKLVEAEEVQRQAFAVGRIVRESMLNLPDRLAALLAGETDARKVHQILTDELTKALEALANG